MINVDKLDTDAVLGLAGALGLIVAVGAGYCTCVGATVYCCPAVVLARAVDPGFEPGAITRAFDTSRGFLPLCFLRGVVRGFDNAPLFRPDVLEGLLDGWRLGQAVRQRVGGQLGFELEAVP